MAKTSDLVNYNSSGLIKDWNSTGLIKDYNSTGYIKNWWTDIVNGTMATWGQVMNGTVTNGLINWATAYNGTLAKTDAANTFTGVQTFNSNITLNNNYLTNGTGGAYIRHNGTGWVISG